MMQFPLLVSFISSDRQLIYSLKSSWSYYFVYNLFYLHGLVPLIFEMGMILATSELQLESVT